MKIVIAIILFSLVILFACTSQKETTTTTPETKLEDLTIYNTSEVTKVMELKKSPCFGKCPVFEMTVYSDGKVSYNGIRFVDKMGKHEMRLSEDRLNALNKKFAAANIHQFENEYKMEVTDLPSTTIGYHANGKSKMIKGNATFPDAVNALVDELDLIGKTEGWMLVGADPSLPKHFIQNELLIQLEKEVQASTWATKFAAQKMKSKKQIAPTSNLWLFTFDASTISPSEMLENVKKAKGVVEAEFNKRLETRN